MPPSMYWALLAETTESPPGRTMVIGPFVAFMGTVTVSDMPSAATVGVALALAEPNWTRVAGPKPLPTMVAPKPRTRDEPASLNQPVMADGVTLQYTVGVRA